MNYPIQRGKYGDWFIASENRKARQHFCTGKLRLYKKILDTKRHLLM